MAFANAVHAQDGTLDLTFNTTGYNNYSNAGSIWDLNFSAGVQSNGKIITCGQSFVGANNNRLLLARYNQNGSLDTTFGTSGVVRTLLGSTTNVATGISCKVLQDNKIVVAGIMSSLTNDRSIYVARFSENGVLDTSFNSPNGFVRIQASLIIHEVHDLEVLTNGKIVVTGYFETFSQPNPVIARVNSNGTLDNTFGVNGIYTTSNFFMRCFDSKTLPDGSVYTVGTTGANFNDLLCLKLKNNGQPDSTFGVNGRVLIDLANNFSATNQHTIDILANRSIIIGATLRNGLAGNAAFDDFAFVKLTPKGTLDNTFGTNGVFSVDLRGSTDALFGLIALDNGKIVASGYSNPSGNTTEAGNDFAITRINANGTLDATFGSLAGRTIVNVGARDNLYRISVQADGKLVIPGYSVISSKGNASITRFNNTGQPVASYTPVVLSSQTNNVQATSAQIQIKANSMGVASTVQVQYSTSSNFSAGTSITSGVSIGSVSNDSTVLITLSGLNGGTGYYFRAIASSAIGSDTGAVSNFIFNNVIPADSLALWLRSDLGVSTSNGTLITGWNDLSPKSNNVGIAPGISQPSLVNNAVNGLPAIRFDGTNDFLTSSKNLDVRNGPSIFIVAKNAVRKDVNAFIKISATHTQVNSHMDFYWQAGSSGNGNLVYAANRPASGFGGLAKARIYPNVGTVNTYYLASCVVPSNIDASGYFNGDSLINSTDNGTGVFLAQGTDRAQIGVLPPTGSFLNGDIAEMIVYNRPLSQTERIQVETYLANRYNLPLNYTPIASLDSVSNLTASSAVLYAAVLPKSLGTQYSFEISTSTAFTNPITTTSGSLAAGTAFTSVNRTVSGLTSGTLYYYRLKMTNAAGTFYSNIAAFRHQTQIPTSGLRTWISADQAVQTTNQKVTAIYDLAEPRRYTSSDTATAPALVTNVLNGKPVLRYDGSNDVLVGNKTIDLRTNFTTIIIFKNRVRKSYNGLFRIASALTGETSNLEIFSDGGGTGNGLQFISVNRAANALATLETNSNGNTFPANNYYVWIDQKSQSGPASGLRLINNTVVAQTLGGNNQGFRTPNSINTPFIGIGYNGTAFGGNKYLDGDIAEVIAYNRVLTAQEISQLHAYLEQKYSLGILKPALSNLSVTKQGTSNTFLASSFTIDNRGVDGSYQLQYSTNKFSTFDTLARQFYTSAQSSFTAQIPALLRYTVYQVRVVASNAFGTDTLSREAMSPFANFDDSQIQGWYRSDGGVVIGTTAGKVQRWRTLRNSGSVSNDLEALLGLQEPSLQTNAINSHDALQFNGSSNTLRSSALVGLQEFTISIVFKALGGLVYEHGANANTNSGAYLNTTNGNTIMVNRFGNRSTKNLAAGWATNNTYRIVTHIYGGSHSSHGLYVNGQQMSMTNGPFFSSFSGFADATFFLGSRNGISNYLSGDIAEVIINRSTLASSGLDSLHAYLAQRYNIGVVTGIADQLFEEANSSFLFYPNPAADQLNVIIKNDGAKNVEIKIYSLDGRVLNSYKLEAENDAITGNLDISTLGAGIYMVELSTNEKTVRKKLIKE